LVVVFPLVTVTGVPTVGFRQAGTHDVPLYSWSTNASCWLFTNSGPLVVRRK
jgi:hypothetical protein